MGAAVSRTVSKKLGIKEGTRAIFLNAPEAARGAIDPPSLDVASELAGEFDYIHGFVESKTLSVDATWSAMKFTYPKKGKVYNNSYGRLPSSQLSLGRG